MITSGLIASTSLNPVATVRHVTGTRINNLTMKNFLSVGAVTLALNLDKHGMTLVLGANTDTNGGLTRNGAGKTTILQAISFALYGKPLSKIKIPNLINNTNNKQMLVTIEFERGENTYRIERGRKPDVMKFFVNNQEMKEEDTGSEQGENRHTQAEIERVIGMSHTMFKHIVALNTYTDPFLRMTVSAQREVIEELLGVTQISQRAETLKKLIGQTKESMRDYQAAIKATLEANSRIENAITTAHTLSLQWTRQHETNLDQLGEEIKALQDIDYEGEIAKFTVLDDWQNKERDIKALLDSNSSEVGLLMRELRSVGQEIAALEAQANPDVVAPVRRLETEKSRKERDIQNLASDIQAKKTELEKLESDILLSGKLECFCCGQELEGTDHLETVLAKMRTNVVKLTTAILEYEKAIADIGVEISHIDEEIAHVIEAAESKKVEVAAALELKNGRFSSKEATLRDLQARTKELNEQFASLGPKPDMLFRSRDEVYKAKQLFDKLVHEISIEAAKENPHAAQVDSFRATLQPVDYTELNELDNLFKHQEFLLRLLTSKDSFIRKKIIDQNLSYLNSRMNHYLDKLGLPHEVKFLSDLSVEIMLLGRDFDFEQLSRGEMNRVIMATSWSFRDVWESLNESFNLMFVDEMLDQGTDSQGVEAALGVLKSMARDRGKNVFLISHRDDLTARIDRILLVHKENGFTRFEEDAVL